MCAVRCSGTPMPAHFYRLFLAIFRSVRSSAATARLRNIITFQGRFVDHSWRHACASADSASSSPRAANVGGARATSPTRSTCSRRTRRSWRPIGQADPSSTSSRFDAAGLSKEYCASCPPHSRNLHHHRVSLTPRSPRVPSPGRKIDSHPVPTPANPGHHAWQMSPPDGADGMPPSLRELECGGVPASSIRAGPCPILDGVELRRRMIDCDLRESRLRAKVLEQSDRWFESTKMLTAWSAGDHRAANWPAILHADGIIEEFQP